MVRQGSAKPLHAGSIPAHAFILSMIEWLVKMKAFRNANHAIWFLCSVGFLVIITSVILRIPITYLVKGMVVIHLFPLVTAAKKKIYREPSEVYSIDCIWFNSLLVIVYVIIWQII